MYSKSELLYALALTRVPNLGAISAKRLIQYVGTPEGVFKEKKSNLLRVKGIGSFKLRDLANKELLIMAEKEIEFMDQNSISCSYFQDSDYPEKLKHCTDGPVLLFHQGNLKMNSERIISVVGTRNITSYGIMLCNRIIEELIPFDPVIVSGLAYGVDITAHKAAINNGLQTIACLAHGLNTVYPKVHIKHLQGIKENGGLLTEFWSTDAFDRNNFLQRNRIIAGISEATIVIQSAEKGGSLVTADIANSYNRDVFAVPGRVTDTQSQGCHNLIKSQKAHILTCAADLVYMMGWEIKEVEKAQNQMNLFNILKDDEKVVFNYLKSREKCLLDKIALSCNFPTSKTATLLLSMELKGVVRPLPGKLFQLIS